MRRNFVLTLLIIGTIAGYASGIYSVTHRSERTSCDRSSWHERDRDDDGHRRHSAARE